MGRETLPRQLIERPYISLSTARFCRERRLATAAARRDVVLVENNTPHQVVKEVRRICISLGCESMILRGVPRERVHALLLQAKVIVAWCMEGFERLPIEGVMCGAVLLTGRCENGQDARDFSIPPRNYSRHVPAAAKGSTAHIGQFFDRGFHVQ